MRVALGLIQPVELEIGAAAIFFLDRALAIVAILYSSPPQDLDPLSYLGNVGLACGCSHLHSIGRLVD